MVVVQVQIKNKRKEVAMSTHALIAVRESRPIGTLSSKTLGFKGVYLHHEGYPEFVEDLLVGYGAGEVSQLLSDFSAGINKLDSKPEYCEPLDQDDGFKPVSVTSIDQLIVKAREVFASYIYLWDGGRWLTLSVNYFN
jgi:hypothetical protein